MVEVYYVVFNADNSVAERGKMEVPRSAIRPQTSGLGLLEWEDEQYLVVHYGDPEVSGGKEWYDVERVKAASGVEDQHSFRAAWGQPLWAGSDPSVIDVCVQSWYPGDRWNIQMVQVLESAIFYKDNHLRLLHDGHEYKKYEPSFNIWIRQSDEGEMHPDDLKALGLPEGN